MPQDHRSLQLQGNGQGEAAMSSGETLYLVLVVTVVMGFAAVLAYYSAGTSVRAASARRNAAGDGDHAAVPAHGTGGELAG